MSLRVLLVSCYEMGHQPLGLASPLGFLRRAGLEAEGIDVATQPLDPDQVRRATFVGISVPMHTALRLGVRVAEQVRALNPSAHVCFYGLYATLNSEYLLSHWADSVVGGEYEESLVALAKSLAAGSKTRPPRVPPRLARLDFAPPSRQGLPELSHYAHLVRGAERLPAGYVEASRGCLHGCRHCPIPPVYGGRFFVVPRQIVMEDIRQQVAAGARHVTFGDPDFLNGPGHSLAVVRTLHHEFPQVTFDFTAKVEHLLKHRRHLEELSRLGCLFVVSAVESLSDQVLRHLNKGHSREDVFQLSRLMRAEGIPLRPTFVAFTPWTTRRDFLELLDWVAGDDLVHHVDPVQYGIRLLIPPGSALLSRGEVGPFLGPLVEDAFSYVWTHPDPGMDELQGVVSAAVERATLAREDTSAVFDEVYRIAAVAAGWPARPPVVATSASRSRPPRLTENWFC